MAHQDIGNGKARPAAAGSGPSNQSGLGSNFDSVEDIASPADGKDQPPKKDGNGNGADHAPLASAAFLEPDAAAMRAHLEWLVAPAQAKHGDALVEIAWDTGGDGIPRHARLFPITAKGLAEAVTNAVSLNFKYDCNIYVGMMLKRPGTRWSKRTRKSDCYVATAIPVDIDKNAEATNAALAQVGTPQLTVTTGTIPERREQKWLRLSEPCTDVEPVESAFDHLVDHVGGDRDAKGAGRLMRLAGSCSYPCQKKQQRGYKPELTTLTVDEAAPAIDIQALIDLPPRMKPETKPPKDETDAAASNGIVEDLTFEELRAALLSIPNDDDVGREDWVRLGAAVFHQTSGSEEGFDLFDEWSRGHPSYDEDNNEKLWKSFSKKRAGRPATARSILKLARENGWRPQRKQQRGERGEQTREEAKTPRPNEDGYISFGDYEMNKTSLRFDDGEKKRYLISAPFKILALCRAKDNEAWGRLIEFTDPDGRTKRIYIANTDLHGGAVVAQRLSDVGLVVVPSKVKDLVDYISCINVSQRARTVDCTGWHGDVFVLPEEVIGESSGEQVVLINPGEHGYAQRGTLQEWKDSVGKLAAPHRLMRLALATMFAGPLLELLNAESGGLHFVAHSSKGKSTGQGMGASIYGRGELKGGYVISWNTTINALEGLAAARSDTGIPIDELSQADPTNVIEMAYMLGNGRGKGRMTREIKLRRSKEFRASVLSSGEKTIEEIIAERYGRKTSAGVQVRLVNIDADAGEGFGAFDSLDGYKSGQALSDAMRKASVTSYGTAGPAFIRAIVEQREQTTTRAREKIKDFEAGFNGLSGEAGRVMRRFAIIAAAGELAIEADVAPWPAGSVTSAAQWAFRRWLKTYGSAKVEIEDRNAAQQICNELENYGDSRFDATHVDEKKDEKKEKTDAPDFDKAANEALQCEDVDIATSPAPNWETSDSERPAYIRYGYRRGKGPTREWLIFPETWRTVFCRGHNPTKVAQMLKDKGCLKTTGTKGLQGAWRVNGEQVWGYVVTSDVFRLLDEDQGV